MLSNKLINYASVNNGKLRLYTELNHAFVVNDIVFINGGYYDNCNKSTNSFNPFNIYNKGYKIIQINDVNSFTIDYTVTNISLIYPYGIANNRFGDPQDNTNLAYNTFTGQNLYKDIFISKCAFIRGNFRSGTINNGIFGSDNNTSYISNTLVNETNVIINHICGKNIEINKSTINLKTHPLLSTTTKASILEDLTNSVNNPFIYSTSVIGNNNDGYGFNIFEKINNNSNILITGGDFSNNRFINLNNLK